MLFSEFISVIAKAELKKETEFYQHSNEPCTKEK